MARYVSRREELPASEITLKQIQSKISGDVVRRTDFLERKKIMRDELVSIIDSRLFMMFAQESYSDMRPYIDATNNIAKRVLREISYVYQRPPRRTVTPKAADKRYTEITNQDMGFNINGVMARNNYLLNGMNDLIMQVAVLGDFIGVHTYTPDMVTVFENQDNPAVLDAIMIEDSYTDKDGRQVKQWIYWSPTRHFIIDENYRMRAVSDNDEMLNPFRDINIATGMFYPFVDLHNSVRETTYWDRYTGSDLFEGAKLIAIQNTFRNFMIPMQFKQISVKVNGVDDGKSIKSNQVKSPLHVFTSNGDISVLDWQSNILQLGESIQNTILGIAGNYGISSENFKLTAQAQSGFARMVAKERLMELRQEQVEVWRDVEVRLFDAIKVVNNLYFPGKAMPDNSKIVVDFSEPRNLEDPLIELDVIRQKVELGVLSIFDVVKEMNPDIKTDEDAEEFIRKNIEQRNKVKSRFSLDFSSLIKGGQDGQGNAGRQGNA